LADAQSGSTNGLKKGFDISKSILLFEREERANKNQSKIRLPFSARSGGELKLKTEGATLCRI
jgi:hypothetical protein